MFNLFKNKEEEKLYSDFEWILNNATSSKELMAINPLLARINLISYDEERYENIKVRAESKFQFFRAKE